MGRRELLEEVVDQQRDVVAALAQRGQLDADDLEPVIEVLAELPLGDGVAQFAMRRRYQTDADLDRLVGPDPDNLAGLEDAEQLDLDGHRHVADLVEEERAAVGVLEPADPVAVRTGEGPLDVAEELALQHVLPQLGAVERDERLVLAGAVDVQGLGDQLLARAALAGDQDRGGRRGDLPELGHHRVHRRRAADHPFETELLVELPLELDIGALEPLRLRRLVGDGPQLVDVQRLDQVIRGPGLHGGDGRLDGAVAGEDHDAGVGQLALGLGQDLHPADPFHDEVGDDDVEDLLLDQAQGLVAAGRDDAFVADPPEALGHGDGVGLLVIDHQDADLLVHLFLPSFRCPLSVVREETAETIREESGPSGQASKANRADARRRTTD